MPARFPYSEFAETQARFPDQAAWLCFCAVVKPRRALSEKTIRKAFDQLIPRNDYAKSERKQLLDYLFALKDSGAESEKSRAPSPWKFVRLSL